MVFEFDGGIEIGGSIRASMKYIAELFFQGTPLSRKDLMRSHSFHRL